MCDFVREKKASKKASPKKVVSETRAGAGGDYKSKEFISSSSSSGSDASDTDDKPLKVHSLLKKRYFMIFDDKYHQIHTLSPFCSLLCFVEEYEKLC